MAIISLPRLLLIAGTGRNSGKTTFACKIIEKFSKVHPIVAIKISSHFHPNVESGPIIINGADLYIAEETDVSKTKDSSLMLAAGAKRSFFVMASDNQVGRVIQTIVSLIERTDYIICESGGLRNYIIPGLFFMMNNINNAKPKAISEAYKELCDKSITFNGNSIDFNIHSVEISNNSWHLKE